MQQYKEEAIMIDLCMLDKLALLVPEINNKNIELHMRLLRGNKLDGDELEEGIKWLSKLLAKNEEIKFYDSTCLRGLFENILAVAVARKNIGTVLMPVITRTVLINTLIQKFGYMSYVEIGVNDPGANFDWIKCDNKQGVDPVPLRADIIGKTSDNYFEGLDKQCKFDLIFIDGLHHYEQVIRDINNSLNHLALAGAIVCHDMLPVNEEMQKVPRGTQEWTGDCWKAWAHFRMNDKNFDMKVVDTDYGLGVIKRGKQELFRAPVSVDKMDYTFFSQYKQKLMNIIDVNTFVELLNLSYKDISNVLHIMNVFPILKEGISDMLRRHLI